MKTITAVLGLAAMFSGVTMAVAAETPQTRKTPKTPVVGVTPVTPMAPVAPVIFAASAPPR